MDRYTRILAIITATYIVLALVWWSVLLFQKNEALFRANLKILELKAVVENPTGQSPSAPEELFLTYRRQRWMVLGESLFILVSVTIGIWLIFRAYLREQEIIRQRRNFLLSITHELKTPLTAMKLAFETIRKRRLSPEQITSLTTSSIHEADRLTETVNNLLLTARVDRKYIPRPELKTIGQIRESWTRKCIHQWPERSINLKINAHDDQQIHADWSGMDIIFRNLTENAIKYSHSSKPIDISLSLRDRYLELMVADQGEGIPPAERHRIFDMFYRIGNEEIRDGKGTGLGLYLVREITRENRGSIQVIDNHPSGTRFIIHLPQ